MQGHGRPLLQGWEASLPPTVKPGLAGPHQRLNANIAAQSLKFLNISFPYQSDRLRKPSKALSWRADSKNAYGAGREVVLDVAHNSDALQALAVP